MNLWLIRWFHCWENLTYLSVIVNYNHSYNCSRGGKTSLICWFWSMQLTWLMVKNGFKNWTVHNSHNILCAAFLAVKTHFSSETDLQKQYEIVIGDKPITRWTWHLWYLQLERRFVCPDNWSTLKHPCPVERPPAWRVKRNHQADSRFFSTLDALGQNSWWILRISFLQMCRLWSYSVWPNFSLFPYLQEV